METGHAASQTTDSAEVAQERGDEDCTLHRLSGESPALRHQCGECLIDFGVQGRSRLLVLGVGQRARSPGRSVRRPCRNDVRCRRVRCGRCGCGPDVSNGLGPHITFDDAGSPKIGTLNLHAVVRAKMPLAKARSRTVRGDALGSLAPASDPYSKAEARGSAAGEREASRGVRDAPDESQSDRHSSEG
jgi:hypothetical protein